MVKFGCFPFPSRSKSDSNFIGLAPEVYKELGRFVQDEISLPDRSVVDLNDGESGLLESQNFIDRIFEFQKTEETGLSGIFDDSKFSEKNDFFLTKIDQNFSILTKNVKCGFCDGRNHFPEDCTKLVTFSERIRKFQNHHEKNCFFCGSRKRPCYCPKRCTVCFGNHHVAICSRSLSKCEKNVFIEAIPILNLNKTLMKKLFKFCSRLDRMKLFFCSKSLRDVIKPEKVFIVESISIMESRHSVFPFSVSRSVQARKMDQSKISELVEFHQVEFLHCNLDLQNCQYLSWSEFCTLTPPGLEKVKISKCRIISCPNLDKVLSRLDWATRVHLGIRNLRFPKNWTTVLLNWKRKTKLQNFVLEVSIEQLEKTKVRDLVKFIKDQGEDFHLRLKIIHYQLLKKKQVYDFVRSLKAYFIVLNMDKETAKIRYSSRINNPAITVEYGKTVVHCFVEICENWETIKWI